MDTRAQCVELAEAMGQHVVADEDYICVVFCGVSVLKVSRRRAGGDEASWAFIRDRLVVECSKRLTMAAVCAITRLARVQRARLRAQAVVDKAKRDLAAAEERLVVAIRRDADVAASTAGVLGGRGEAGDKVVLALLAVAMEGEA